MFSVHGQYGPIHTGDYTSCVQAFVTALKGDSFNHPERIYTLSVPEDTLLHVRSILPRDTGIYELNLHLDVEFIDDLDRLVMAAQSEELLRFTTYMTISHADIAALAVTPGTSRPGAYDQYTSLYKEVNTDGWDEITFDYSVDGMVAKGYTEGYNLHKADLSIEWFEKLEDAYNAFTVECKRLAHDRPRQTRRWTTMNLWDGAVILAVPSMDNAIGIYPDNRWAFWEHAEQTFASYPHGFDFTALPIAARREIVACEVLNFSALCCCATWDDGMAGRIDTWAMRTDADVLRWRSTADLEAEQEAQWSA